MTLRPIYWFPLAFAGIFGCRPKIGDDCVTDLDCSQVGDRICDTTQPGGYCTQVDCDPFSCPQKESICIAYNDSPSTVGACNTSGVISPYRRTFCMDTCKDQGDCRPGYRCRDMAKENPWGAVVIQSKPKRTTACVVDATYESLDPDGADQVCTGAPSDADVSSGGAGGASGN